MLLLREITRLLRPNARLSIAFVGAGDGFQAGISKRRRRSSRRQRRRRRRRWRRGRSVAVRGRQCPG